MHYTPILGVLTPPLFVAVVVLKAVWVLVVGMAGWPLGKRLEDRWRAGRLIGLLLGIVLAYLVAFIAGSVLYSLQTGGDLYWVSLPLVQLLITYLVGAAGVGGGVALGWLLGVWLAWRFGWLLGLWGFVIVAAIAAAPYSTGWILGGAALLSLQPAHRLFGTWPPDR